MKRKNKIKTQSLFSFRDFLLFFTINAFVLTCCTLMLLGDVDPVHVKASKNAVKTFFNVIALSVLFSLLHGIYNKFTFERPVQKILEASKQVVKGDFSVRIKPLSGIKENNSLATIIDNFNEMVSELSSIETLRTDFISNVSHELKTPLTTIQNYSELLQDETISKAKQVEYAKNINNACHDLNSLITNILKINRLENQKIFLDKKSFNLSEQIIQSILSFESIWEAKQINLNIDIEENIMIENDEELLMIVWNNLFSNAFKFTDDKGTVSVKVKKENNHITVTISDTGCGMTMEVGKHIFEKFYQGDSSHATKGNGLGLALVKRIIDIMEADIHVESILGKGTTFTVVIEEK